MIKCESCGKKYNSHNIGTAILPVTGTSKYIGGGQWSTQDYVKRKICCDCIAILSVTGKLQVKGSN